MEHERFKALLFEYIISNKGSKKALQALSTMQEAYATLTFVKQSQNPLFINVLITVVVSNATYTNHQHITKTIGATKYMVWKVVECHAHMDETNQNLWGGLFQKRHCDTINEGDSEVVFKWWEASTTMSPISKRMSKGGASMPRCLTTTQQIIYKNFKYMILKLT